MSAFICSKSYEICRMGNEQSYLSDLIDRAIHEDIGSGDHSGNSCIPSNARGKMQLLVKEDGVLAGVEVAKMVFDRLESGIEFEVKIADGSPVKKGDIAFTISGSERTLLKGERLALNLMQRMSGIASRTNQLVRMIEGTGTRLLDTRKTTPNLRYIEKWAVRIGGGHNHRMGLYDMIMLKDNHIDFAGGIAAAISKTLDYLAENKLDIPIEVETRSFDEIREVLATEGVQRIMFDNFSVEDTKKAVALVNGKIETESSGGITEENIVSYAQTGVDFISVGAITHSVKGLDLSLKAI